MSLQRASIWRLERGDDNWSLGITEVCLEVFKPKEDRHPDTTLGFRLSEVIPDRKVRQERFGANDEYDPHVRLVKSSPDCGIYWLDIFPHATGGLSSIFIILDKIVTPSNR